MARVGVDGAAKTAGLAATAAGGGVILWFTGSWLFDSVRLWWGWLGQHF